MKKHIKRLPLYIPLTIVLLFLVVWGASLMKCFGLIGGIPVQ